MKPLFSTPGPELRARANFIAYCPLCSFVGIPDAPDILVYPFCRRHPPTRLYPQEHFKLQRCCSLSIDGPWMDTEADVAAWWIERRTIPHGCIATQNRQAATLTKLREMQLEPIVAPMRRYPAKQLTSA